MTNVRSSGPDNKDVVTLPPVHKISFKHTFCFLSENILQQTPVTDVCSDN